MNVEIYAESTGMQTPLWTGVLPQVPPVMSEFVYDGVHTVVLRVLWLVNPDGSSLAQIVLNN